MAELVTALGSAKFFGVDATEDDFVNQLHHTFTSGLLLMLTLAVSWKQFGGKPIECLVPDQLSDVGAEEYTEVYCFTKNTYFVPWDKQVPEHQADRIESQISYYQWVPFFLLIQALMFRVPCLFWNLVATHSGSVKPNKTVTKE